MATGSKKQMLVKSTVKKSTSLEELEQTEKGSVFIINTTTGDLNGQILINVPKRHGNGNDLVKIPKTFIPIDLTTQVTKAQLLESSEFRKTVTGGLIKLVTADYAQVLLSSEQGREEKRRIDNEANKSRTILANAGVTEETNEADEESDYVEIESVGKEAKKAAKLAGGGEKAAVSIKLQTLVNSAAEEDNTEREIVGKLLNYNSGRLAMVELDYLRKKYANKPRIMKHLKEVYRELKAEA